MNFEYLPAGLNGVLSLTIILVSVCRLNAIHKLVLFRVKVQYPMLIMGAAANGASPWMWEMPSWPSVAFSAAVLFCLVADSYQWRAGPPESATSPSPLE